MNTAGAIAVEVVRHCGLIGLVANIRACPDRYPIVPISPARAATHAANPDADPDDPALLLVMVDDRCRGYLGLMPQMIAGDTAPRKVFAFTTLLVDAPLRGTGVADLLLDLARNFGPLLTIGNSKAAQGFFRKRGMTPLPAYRVLYLPLGLGHGLARMRAGLRKRLGKHGWRTTAAAGEVGFGLLAQTVSFWRRRAVGRLLSRLHDEIGSVEACALIPDDAAGVMAAMNEGVVWRPATLNWLLSENQRSVLPDLQQPVPDNYHFRASALRRTYEACLLREHGQLRGVALFQHHHVHDQSTLSILLSFVPDPGWLPLIARHALGLSLQHGADVIRAGTEFEVVFKDLAQGSRLPTRNRLGFVDVKADPHAFDHYREALADGDIALY